MFDTLDTFLALLAVVAFFVVMYMLGSRHERKHAEKEIAEMGHNFLLSSKAATVCAVTEYP